MNIIGVRLTMTYTESEDTSGDSCAQGGKPQQILSLEQPYMESTMKLLVVVTMETQAHTQLKYIG